MIKILAWRFRLWLAELIVPKSHAMTWEFSPRPILIDLSPSEYRRVS